MARMLLALAAAGLAGCASAPTGPSIMVLPGSGKSFEEFRLDDYDCRVYAHAQSGAPGEGAANSGVASAAVGAAVGTVAGAAIAGSRGAGVGAGLGLATGAVAGTGAAAHSAAGAQQRYDVGYQQCMYAKGHKIPMATSPSSWGRHASPRRYRDAVPPPPPPPRT